MQRDAHVPQLFDRQQRRDDVLAEAVVDQHLRGRNHQLRSTGSSSHTGHITVTTGRLTGRVSHLPYWLSRCVLRRRSVEVEHPLQSDCGGGQRGRERENQRGGGVRRREGKTETERERDREVERRGREWKREREGEKE